jgi:hypothetical protein
MTGINDISKRSDLPKVLMKVEEKFRLDLSGKSRSRRNVAAPGAVAPDGPALRLIRDRCSICSDVLF